MDHTSSLSTYGVMKEVLAWELIRCRRYRRVISVLLINLDHLMEVNVPAAAEQVSDVIRVVRTQIREVDLVGARDAYGLLVLLPETGKQGALVVADRLRHVIEAHQWSSSHSADAMPVAVSIGVAGYLDDGDSADGLLEAAQWALQEVRAQRRKWAKNGLGAAGAVFGEQRHDRLVYSPEQASARPGIQG